MSVDRKFSSPMSGPCCISTPYKCVATILVASVMLTAGFYIVLWHSDSLMLYSTSHVIHNNVQHEYNVTKSLSTYHSTVISQLLNWTDQIAIERAKVMGEIIWQNRSVYGPYIQSVNAYYRGYFDNISLYNSDIKTLYLRLPQKVLSTVMPKHYYHTASNKCEWMLKGLYGGTFLKSYAQIECFDNWTQTLNPSDQDIVFKNAFALGLPALYKHTSDDGQLHTVTFLHVINNAIITNHGDVFVNQLRIIPQRCMQNDYEHVSPKSVNKYKVYSEVFSISQFWGHGFFHFTVENYPRLTSYVPFLIKNPQIKIHIAASGFADNFIAELGINTNGRLVTGNVRADILYQPAGTPCGRPTYFNSVIMSQLMRSPLAEKPKRDVIVLIQRTNRGDRYFKHHSAY